MVSWSEEASVQRRTGQKDVGLAGQGGSWRALERALRRALGWLDWG